jgi:hypothetical protein
LARSLKIASVNALDVTLIVAWCRERGVLLTDDADAHGLIGPADDPTLEHRVRLQYAGGARSGQEGAFAAAGVRALRSWDECLVWITGWGIWPSGEDWPQFYAWRGQHGERRSLDAAPGHRFLADEARELEILLQLVLENAWDATAVPASNRAAMDQRVVISHDEWIELRSREPAEFRAPGAEAMGHK